METTATGTGRRELTAARYSRLALASAVSLYLIVLTGAAVRLTGSGLACESWPGCQEGAFFPAVGEHSSIEFGNRVMALFPIGLSLAAWIFSYRTPGLARWVRWLAAFTFLGTIAQAPLGLLTIRLDLHPLMVGTHFLLALVVLATAMVLAVEAWGNAYGRVESPVPRWLRLLGLVLARRLRGPRLHRHALDGRRPASGRQRRDRALLEPARRGLHPRPRDGGVRDSRSCVLLIWLHRNRDRAGVLAPGAGILLALLLVQMAVGELQWRNQLPWWLVLIHVGLAALVWAWTVGLVTALWRTPRTLSR